MLPGTCILWCDVKNLKSRWGHTFLFLYKVKSLGRCWSKEAFHGQVISGNICEWGHCLWWRIAFLDFLPNFFFFWINFQSREASYDRLISTDICELGHGLCRRIAFVLERSGGAVRKFPKLCNSQPAHQQKPELPETKWEFTFLQLWNEKRAKKNHKTAEW